VSLGGVGERKPVVDQDLEGTGRGEGGEPLKSGVVGLDQDRGGADALGLRREDEDEGSR
jgi:hypothetical protein